MSSRTCSVDSFTLPFQCVAMSPSLSSSPRGNLSVAILHRSKHPESNSLERGSCTLVQDYIQEFRIEANAACGCELSGLACTISLHREGKTPPVVGGLISGTVSKIKENGRFRNPTKAELRQLSVDTITKKAAQEDPNLVEFETVRVQCSSGCSGGATVHKYQLFFAISADSCSHSSQNKFSSFSASIVIHSRARKQSRPMPSEKTRGTKRELEISIPDSQCHAPLFPHQSLPILLPTPTAPQKIENQKNENEKSDFLLEQENRLLKMEVQRLMGIIQSFNSNCGQQNGPVPVQAPSPPLFQISNDFSHPLLKQEKTSDAPITESLFGLQLNYLDSDFDEFFETTTTDETEMENSGSPISEYFLGSPRPMSSGSPSGGESLSPLW